MRSEKRFDVEVVHTVAINEYDENGELVDYWDITEICKKLNEQIDEIEKLKKENEALRKENKFENGVSIGWEKEKDKHMGWKSL